VAWSKSRLKTEEKFSGKLYKWEREWGKVRDYVHLTGKVLSVSKLRIRPKEKGIGKGGPGGRHPKQRERLLRPASTVGEGRFRLLIRKGASEEVINTEMANYARKQNGVFLTRKKKEVVRRSVGKRGGLGSKRRLRGEKCGQVTSGKPSDVSQKSRRGSTGGP